MAMVFQSYALYPHLTVAKNIEFPLRQRGVDKEERPTKVKRAAETLGLGTLLDRKPASSRAASASGSRWPGPSCASRSSS